MSSLSWGLLFQKKMSDYFSLLSDELIVMICSQLDIKSLINLSHTNSKLHDLIDGDKFIWEKVFDQLNISQDPWLTTLALSIAKSEERTISKNEQKLLAMIHFKTKQNWLSYDPVMRKCIRPPPNFDYYPYNWRNYNPKFVIMDICSYANSFHFIAYDVMKNNKVCRFSIDIRALCPKIIRNVDFPKMFFNFPSLLIIEFSCRNKVTVVCFEFNSQDFSAKFLWADRPCVQLGNSYLFKTIKLILLVCDNNF